MEMGSWWPTQGDGYMLLVFAAVFIGGTSVFGGSGRLYGTLIGIAIVGMIEAGIVSSGPVGFWTRAVHGMSRWSRYRVTRFSQGMPTSVFCVWYGGEKGRASSKPLSREKRQVASGAHCLIRYNTGKRVS